MSHEIESIAYVGDVPWHGIGEVLTGNPTPQEMLVQASLDWTVSKRPLFTANTPRFKTEADGFSLLIEDYSALVRDSDNKVLGLCGPKYQPFQNSETFEFFNKFTEAGQMKIEVAGSLKGGHWVWCLARLNGCSFTLPGDDVSHSFLLLCSPHVWGEALTVMFTPIRVVCWNTLTQSMGKKLAEKFRFVHTGAFQNVKALAELSVEQAILQHQIYKEKAKLLAEQKVVEKELYEYIATLFQPTLLAPGPVNPTQFNSIPDQILMNYHMAPGSRFASADHTWWGAYNGVTYYFDHQVGRTGPDIRIYNSWVGHTTAVTKRKAFDLAVQYAEKAVN